MKFSFFSDSIDSDGKHLNTKIDYIKEELKIRIYSLKTCS